MTAPERFLAPLDVRLLAALEREPNLVHAARAVGVSRDRAVYRLARLARLFGGPAALGRRGGATPGATHLTPLGRRLLDRARGARPGTNRWAGRYVARPSPRVELAGGGTLEVAFRAPEGSRVSVEVDPEAFVVARTPAALSARNALAVVLRRVQHRRDGTAVLEADWQGRRVRAALTEGSIVRLGLRPGRRAYLYAKAVAVRRVASPGPLRS